MDGRVMIDPDQLRRIAGQVWRLTVDRRNPEQFHFAKEQIEFDLKQLARKLEIAQSREAETRSSIAYSGAENP